ncbi:MAG: DUF1624 domain-containing protein [Candidatus Aminicenantes bacterium]|nr:DUF1624 domain-containing protein [Candidatus Aminicenantes bacterium]
MGKSSSTEKPNSCALNIMCKKVLSENKMDNKILLSENEINTGRQTELDIAKGLAIAFMIFDHVLECYASTQLENTVFADVIYFLACVPAEPVFMFLMGVGFL